MKQKRKHLLKKFLIFGIAFMLASCSEELFDEAIESSNKRAIKEVRFNELYQDSKFKNLLEKVSHNSNAARTSFENQNGFTISDGFVKVIETDSVVSYTMLIERDVVTDTISFENLVIQENKFNASEKAYSIKYTPTTIEPSGHDSFYYEGTEELKSLAFTGFNRAGAYANTTESNCYVDVVQIWCSDPNPGSTQHHVARSGCSISTLYFKTVSVYSPESCDNNNSSSSGSNNTDAPQGPTGPGDTGGITSPVKPDQSFGNNIINTPCSRIKAHTAKPKFKTNLATLMNPNNFTLNYEKGFGDVIGMPPQWLSPAPNKPSTSLQPVPGLKNFTHIHPDKPTTINGIVYDGNVKIFSPGDLSILLGECYFANGNTPEESYAIMLSNDIHYAMQLSAPLTPDEFTTLTNKFSKFKTNFDKLCIDIVVITDVDERNEALQKMFLEEMNKLGIGNKLSLFSGTITNPTTNPVTNWTKLSLTNGTIVHEPCN